MAATTTPHAVQPDVLAGTVLGIGLGGFVDGIVLHQVLQWHHMLTAYDHQHYPMTTVAGLEINTLWDGLFHGSMWVAVAFGLVLLMRASRLHEGRMSGRALFGAMLGGWGGFNLVEGIVDHHILGLHHVRDDLGAPLARDLGFLAFGAVLLVVGWLLVRTVRGGRAQGGS